MDILNFRKPIASYLESTQNKGKTEDVWQGKMDSNNETTELWKANVQTTDATLGQPRGEVPQVCMNIHSFKPNEETEDIRKKCYKIPEGPRSVMFSQEGQDPPWHHLTSLKWITQVILQGSMYVTTLQEDPDPSCHQSLLHHWRGILNSPYGFSLLVKFWSCCFCQRCFYSSQWPGDQFQCWR